METETIWIDCYGERRFEIPGERKTFGSKDQLTSYCQKLCNDGSKPSRIYMVFRGMIPRDIMDEIIDWKRNTLDAMIKR